MCTVLLPPSLTIGQLPGKALALPGIETYLFYARVPSQDVLLRKYITYKDWGSSEPGFQTSF